MRATAYPKTLLVPSLSEEGKSWEVEQHGTRWVCECPRFAFGKQPQRCSHTDIAAYAEHLLQHCKHADAAAHTSELILCRQCLVRVLASAARKVRTEYVEKAAAAEKLAAARARKRKKKEAT